MAASFFATCGNGWAMSSDKHPPDSEAPQTGAEAPVTEAAASAMESGPPSSETANQGEEPFAFYLAKRNLAQGFRPGVPAEAEDLLGAGDVALHYPSFGLVMAVFVDRQTTKESTFCLSKERLAEIGKACERYSGTVNGAKLPVQVVVYEVGNGPPSADDKERLRQLTRAKHCRVTAFYLDVEGATVFCPESWNGLLRGRRKLEKMLREPRIPEAQLFQPSPALPMRERRPDATIAVVAVLVLAFVAEHVFSAGDKGAGLLGLGPGTLYALGGMNTDALVKDGEVYRLFSAALLHADAFHLLMNGVALVLGGVFLESLLGRAWFLTLLGLGALGGSAMGAMVNPSSNVSVGASGAIMGLLSASLVLAWRFPQGPERTQIQVQMAQFLVPSLIPLATHRMEGKVDYGAHFGGALTGVVLGLLILKIWPKEQEHPRFAKLSHALAALLVVGFVGSVALAANNYDKHAADVRFDNSKLLVANDKVPQDVEEAKRTVEVWGKEYPRDPRVHLYRALKLLDGNDAVNAEKELRALLAEREILDRAFGNRKLEILARGLLCEILVRDGRMEEAKREAAPVCNAENGGAPEYMRELKLCP